MVRVVDRIGRILAAFTSDRPDLALTDCANLVGLNKTTTYRLLQSLEEIGLVERDAQVWRLGPRLVTLATIRVGRFDLRREALKHLREVQQAFPEAVAFSVPDGRDMIYLERLDSPDAYGVNARLGTRAPMWAGGSGKAVLARMAPSARKALLDVKEWHELPSLLREVAEKEIREAGTHGYCVDEGAFFNGIGGVAVAISGRDGEPVAAISVIVPNDRLDGSYATALGERLLTVVSELEEAAALGV